MEYYALRCDDGRYVVMHDDGPMMHENPFRGGAHVFEHPSAVQALYKMIRTWNLYGLGEVSEHTFEIVKFRVEVLSTEKVS